MEVSFYLFLDFFRFLFDVLAECLVFVCLELGDDAREQESLEPFREFMMEEHIRNITKEIETFKKSLSNDPINLTSDPINTFDDPIKQQLYQAVVADGTLNYAAYAAQLGVSEATVKRRLGELKTDGIIIRVGSNKTGHWEVAKQK